MFLNFETLLLKFILAYDLSSLFFVTFNDLFLRKGRHLYFSDGYNIFYDFYRR